MFKMPYLNNFMGFMATLPPIFVQKSHETAKSHMWMCLKSFYSNFQGIFLRYPNPFATHVLSEDTLHREFRGNGVLYTRRLLTKTNKIPKWGEKFLVNFKRMVPLVPIWYETSFFLSRVYNSEGRHI